MDNSAEEVGKPNFFVRHKSRLLVVLVIVGCAVFAIVDSQCCGHIKAFLDDLEEFVQDNPAVGCILIAVVYAVCTVGFLPGAALTLASGVIFGNAWNPFIGTVVGSVAVFIGAFAGACAAFFLGRFACRPCVGRMGEKYKFVKVLERIFSSQGSSLKLLILLRLSPVMPFTASNYLFGMLPVHTKHYLIALFFILPGTITYVAIGAFASSFNSDRASLIGLLVGVPLLIIALVLIIIAAKKELAIMLEEDRLAEEARGEAQIDGDAEEGAAAGVNDTVLDGGASVEGAAGVDSTAVVNGTTVVNGTAAEVAP